MLPEQIKKENNLGTLKYFFLNFITFGIFEISKISKTSKLISKFSNKKVYPDFLVLSIQLSRIIIVSLLFMNWEKKEEEGNFFTKIKNSISKRKSDKYNSLKDFCCFSAFICLILIKFWAFISKEQIEEYARNEIKDDYKMNSIYTFIFDKLYINYCLNDLSKEKNRKKNK